MGISTESSTIQTKIPAPCVLLLLRRTPEGMVRLWCVGLDRVDDGGKRIEVVRWNSNEKGVKGDWVWSYSPKK
jgi:hypothetical protein